MSNLRVAMDAAFWDLSLSTPQTLDGVARSVPGEPLPLRAAPACRALRPQQLSLLRNGFPLGLIPSLSPTFPKDLGSFAVQTLLFNYAAANWWVGFVGQFRPKKLLSSLKADFSGIEELEFRAIKDIAKHFVNKSMFSLNLCTQLSLSPFSSLFFATEGRGGKKGRRSKAMFMHKLPYHDVTLEAAWPELFLDSKGCYWDVPASVSLDLQSLVNESGFRYRFGLHKNSGQPSALSDTCGSVPSSLMPGVCAQAAFSYEKSKDLWRQEDEKKDLMLKPDKSQAHLLPYDVRLGEPHAAVSGLIGGFCTAWLSGSRNSAAVNTSPEHSNPIDSTGISSVRMGPQFGVDSFASLCYTFQHGTFRKTILDLTRIDAKVDMCSAPAFLKASAHALSDLLKGQVNRVINPLAAPRFNIIFQQQVAGPIVFRVDSRLSLDSSSRTFSPQVEDIVYSLNYSLRLLRSGKVVAWYSPRRKEGMIELRFFEC